MDTSIITQVATTGQRVRAKLTPESQRAICDALGEGASVTQAVQAAGASRNAFYQWLKKPEFRKAVQDATRKIEASNLERYRNARGFYQDIPTNLLSASPSGKLDGRKRYIYLIRESFQGLVKIGIATDLYARMVAMEASCPQELELISYVVSSNAKVIEGYIHQRFSEKRYKGEWFRLDSQDVALVLEICKAYDTDSTKKRT